MVPPILTPGLPRRLLPFAVFLTAFTVVMMILFLSMDLRAVRHHEVFNFTEDLDFSSVGQDNPQFIAYVKAVHLRAPAAQNYLEENLTMNPLPQTLLVARLLNNKMRGTFVETGAYRHGKPSNTEWLEMALSWHGLLIQPDPWDFLTLRRQRRKKSSSVHACLSPTSYPKEVTFRQISGAEGVGSLRPVFTRVKCFPLFSLLLAANMTRVDYLSLDAEGAEAQVLKTLPLERVEIKIIGLQEKSGKNAAIHAFMEAHRYKLIEKLASYSVFKLDNEKPHHDHSIIQQDN